MSTLEVMNERDSSVTKVPRKGHGSAVGFSVALVAARGSYADNVHRASNAHPADCGRWRRDLTLFHAMLRDPAMASLSPAMRRRDSTIGEARNCLPDRRAEDKQAAPPRGS